MSTLEEVKSVFVETLQIGDMANSFDENTALLGSIPEFDSMAVVSVITALEENFGFIVEDDDINGEVFETLGSLVAFVKHKM